MATTDDDEDRAGDETVERPEKRRSSLSGSVDKEGLFRRAVAHAAEAAVHFSNEDHEDDDDSDVQGNPDIARNPKVELSVAAEQPADLEEAPSATEKCARAALQQSPIPVIEAATLVLPRVFEIGRAHV